MKTLIQTTATLSFLLLGGTAMAGAGHGSSGHGSTTALGAPGHAEDVDREIAVSMTEMKFDLDSDEIRPGETVRFLVSNDGRVVHEFNLGTPESWKAHDGEMRAMFKKGMMSMRKIDHDKMMAAGMMHDDPNSVLLEPGETAELIWTFPDHAEQVDEVAFACNVPGHLAAGMKGEFDVATDAAAES